MRILIITHYFPPGHIGSTETPFTPAKEAQSTEAEEDSIVICSSGTECLHATLKKLALQMLHGFLSSHHKVNWSDTLACPKCYGDVIVPEDAIHCPNCRLDYPWEKAFRSCLSSKADL